MEGFIMKKFIIIKAFTLAEILITLAIIGVVAAITVPSLMNKINDQQYKIAYKKAFSVASQAWQHGVADNAFVARESQYDGTNNYANWEIFKSYFKVEKDCNNVHNYKCWDWTGEKSNGNPQYSDVGAFIDSSGMAWSMRTNISSTTITSSYFIVDTNGFKKPNQYGKDRWVFIMANKDDGFDGLPVKIIVPDDHESANSVACPSGGCYYKSWLSE